MRIIVAFCLTACVAPEVGPHLTNAHAETTRSVQSAAVRLPVPPWPTVNRAADKNDPLLVSIVNTTDIFSDAGTRITDWEWSAVCYGAEESALDQGTWLSIMSLLMVTDGDIVRSLCFSDAAVDKHVSRPPPLSQAAPATAEAWELASKDGWEQRPMFPWRASGDVVAFWLNEMARARNGLAMLSFAMWVVVDANNETVAYRLGYMGNSCGWCTEGDLVTFSATGVELAREQPSEYSSSGYCC